MSKTLPCQYCGVTEVPAIPKSTANIKAIAASCEHAFSSWIPIEEATGGMADTVTLAVIIARQVASLMRAAERSDDPETFTPHTNRFMYAFSEPESDANLWCEIYAPDKYTMTLGWGPCPNRENHYHGTMDAQEWALGQLVQDAGGIADLLSGDDGEDGPGIIVVELR